jgi:retinol dehydrogenase 12
MSEHVRDKTILITGANTGLGRATAEALAKRGARLYLACRSEERTQPVINAIKRERPDAFAAYIPLELSDLESVRACAARFIATGEPLHVLVNNAGIAGQRGTTRQGFELAFGTNHLGHFLLTQLLLPRLRESAPARIVHVASDSHYDCKSIEWTDLQKPTKTYMAMREYEVSKLCNILFAREFARRFDGAGVRSYAVDPGTVASDIWRKIPWPIRSWMKRSMITPEEGAFSAILCASDPSVANEDGLYYAQNGEKREPSDLAKDEELARALWTRSAEWTGLSAS